VSDIWSCLSKVVTSTPPNYFLNPRCCWVVRGIVFLQLCVSKYRCSGKFVAPENYSHTQQYGLGLKLRIGLNLGLALGVGLRLGLGLGLGLRLGLGLASITL